MAQASKIEWTDATWNPVVGCSVISPGCTNCYAIRMAARLEATGKAPHYAGTTRKVNGKAAWTGKVALAPDSILKAPLHWKKPRRIFVNSMGDLFHTSVPDGWIDRVFAVMALCPQHTFMVLTKRPARMREYFDTAPRYAPASPPQWPLPNVMLGVTAEDQQRANERIPILLDTPAAKRFVSIEPMLGPVDLTAILCSARGEDGSGDFFLNALYASIWDHVNGLIDQHESYGRFDLVIVGGESGPGARPMHPEWPRSIRDQCETAGVPFHFKQWGEWLPLDQFPSQIIEGVGGHVVIHLDGHFAFDTDIAHPPNDIFTFRVGKKAAGRLLDGEAHDGDERK